MEPDIPQSEPNLDNKSAANAPINPHEKEEGNLAARDTGDTGLTQSEEVAQNNPPIEGIQTPPFLSPPSPLHHVPVLSSPCSPLRALD